MMTRDHLQRANRALLEAIECPPESGIEGRLDHLAATIWQRTAEGRPALDPGRVAHILRKLERIEDSLPPHRARYVRRARRHVRAYGETTASS